MRTLILSAFLSTSVFAAELPVACSAVAGDLQVAAATYPATLDAQYAIVADDDRVAPRQTCARRLSADRLVVAYSNTLRTVLSVVAAPNHVVAEYSGPPALKGGTPTIALADLDGDDSPEVILVIETNGHSASFVMKYDGSSLRSIGPTVRARNEILTTLSAPQLTDVTGDGIPELAESNSTRFDPEPVPAYNIYTVTPNGTQPLNEVALTGEYHRSPGEPDVYEHNVRATPGDYTLRIITNKIAAGEIRLNGTVVINPDDFKRNAARTEVPVQLHATNNLRLELRGDVAGSVTLLITKR